MKVLIIEDETKLANALSRGLRQESYATEVYNNGGWPGGRLTR